jgi:hypothetical protein
MIGQNKAAVDPDPQPTEDALAVEEGNEQQ